MPILKFLEEDPEGSADKLAGRITRMAKTLSRNNKAHDDISAVVLKAVEPKNILLFTGPPFNTEQDSVWAEMFNGFKGKKAVSGGTTAKILARELKRELFNNGIQAGNFFYGRSGFS